MPVAAPRGVCGRTDRDGGRLPLEENQLIPVADLVKRWAGTTRAGLTSLLAALAVCAATGCAIISVQDVGVSTGPVSDQWDVQWDPQTRTPTAMTNRSLQDIAVNRGTPAVSDSAAEAAVAAVVQQHAEWFRMRPGVDALVPIDSRVNAWLRDVRLQQTYRGVPVAGVGYVARVLPSGRVSLIQGRCQPDIELIVTPSVDAQTAESHARAALVSGRAASDLPILQVENERFLRGDRVLVIVPIERGLTLAWAVIVEHSPSERSRVYVSAETGAVLGAQTIAGSWMRR